MLFHVCMLKGNVLCPFHCKFASICQDLHGQLAWKSCFITQIDQKLCAHRFAWATACKSCYIPQINHKSVFELCHPKTVFELSPRWHVCPCLFFCWYGIDMVLSYILLSIFLVRLSWKCPCLLLYRPFIDSFREHLRIPHGNDAKITEICNFLTF